MQSSAFEDLLLSAAGDGWVAPIGRRPTPPVEVEEILEAWSIERHRSIEFEILLEQSRAAIAEMLAADQRCTTPDHLRDIRGLLRQIDSQLDAGPPDPA